MKCPQLIINMTLERTHQVIWKSCYAFFVLLFVIWFFTAIGNYMTRSASSSVSLKFGDSGDKMVVFPVLTFCKYLDPKAGLWRGIRYTCKGKELINLQPPYFMNYINDCLEHDDSLEPEDLFDWLTYDVDDVILDVIFGNPEYPNDVTYHTPIIGGNGPHWKTKRNQILSSHYDLHFGHCYNLDFAPLSPYNNGKFLINKGVVFVDTSLSINVYPPLVTLEQSMEKSRRKREADENFPLEGSGEESPSFPMNVKPTNGGKSSKGKGGKDSGGNSNACDTCEKTPFSVFINNGTDLDRLGENIVERELTNNGHLVSMSLTMYIKNIRSIEINFHLLVEN